MLGPLSSKPNLQETDFMLVRVKALNDRARVPVYATTGASAFDFFATDAAIVAPGRPAIVGTGLAFELPEEKVLLVMPRSGHGFNLDVRLSNCVGVIDHDYRGEVKIKLRSDENEVLRISEGDRIAQGIIVDAEKVQFQLVDKLSETERGEGGFGHTGA
jgi:dUTP pyrophosphatase